MWAAWSSVDLGGTFHWINRVWEQTQKEPDVSFPLLQRSISLHLKLKGIRIIIYIDDILILSSTYTMSAWCSVCCWPFGFFGNHDQGQEIYHNAISILLLSRLSVEHSRYDLQSSSREVRKHQVLLSEGPTMGYRRATLSP